MGFFSSATISDLKANLSREEVISRGRILVVDDERPDLVDDLENEGFCVTYKADLSNDNFHLVRLEIYDLILLDFAGVGASFGVQEGLSLLKHIKRVSPAVFVLAYTSKGLKSNDSDFFRLADGVLSKDAGIGDSFEKIEEALKGALCIENRWKAFLISAGVTAGSKEDLDLQDKFVAGIKKSAKMKDFRSMVSSVASSEAAQKAAIAALPKIIEAATKVVFS